MKNWLKKVLSVLTAIALLVSAGVLAFAEEPIDPNAADEVVLNGEPTADAPAADPAPEAAPAAEETSNNEETPAQEGDPAPEGAPSEDAAPAQDDAPAQDETPSQDETPAHEDAPTQEDAPAQEVTPAQEEAPAQEDVPAQDVTPAQEESTVQEGASGQEGTPEEPEPEPVPSYYNNEETPVDDPIVVDNTPVVDTPDNSGDGVVITYDEETGEKIYTDDEGTYSEDELTTFVDGDNGGSDLETIVAMGLETTDEVKFADATWLSLNDSCTGTVDNENKDEYVIKWESSQAIVLGLEASSSDLDVVIKGTPITFEETEGTEDQPGFTGTYKMNILADTVYDIVISSQNPVSYTLTVKDAFAVADTNDETEKTEIPAPAEVNNTEGTEETNENNNEANTEDNNDNNEDNNNEETATEEGNGDNNSESNTNNETIVNDFPVIRGWITIDTEAFNVDSTITLKANADVELGDMVFWQTKVQNENGEEVWEGLGYGATYTVKLDKDNIKGTFRFKMEGENYSDEYTLGTIEEEAEENVEVSEPAEGEAVEENKEEANEEETKEEENNEEEKKETVEETEKTDEEMIELGYTKIVVTAEEGADLFAETSKESEVLGHLDAETKIWVLLNEEGTWGQLFAEATEEDEEVAPAQFISMEDAKIAGAEEEVEMTEEEIEAIKEKEMTELGYRKVKVENTKGIDVFASTEEGAEAIEHIDPETELWIKDAKIEGWAQLFTEKQEDETEEVVRFIKLADLEKVLTDEEMLKMGYYKVMVILEIGADVYEAPNEEYEIINHLDNGTELWVKPMEDSLWAEIFAKEDEEKQYIYLADMAATKKPEESIELPIRKITLTSSLDGATIISLHQEVLLEVQLENFLEDDVYTCEWQYTPDEGETFVTVEESENLNYTYVIEKENRRYGWRMMLKLLPKE